MTAKVVMGGVLDVPVIRGLMEGIGAEFIQVPLKNEDDIIAKTSDADAVLVGHDPYTKKVIQAMTKCKVISRVGIGYNNIDVEEEEPPKPQPTLVREIEVEEEPPEEDVEPAEESQQQDNTVP